MEQLAGAFEWYISLLEHIAGTLVEPPPEGINLAAEYRWELPQHTDYLLGLASGEFADVLSAELRQSMEELVAAAEVVPRDTLSLDEPLWQPAKELALALLPAIQAVATPILAKAGWSEGNGAA